MTRALPCGLLVVLLVLSSSSVHAADQALTKTQLEALIVGRTVTFSDGGRASYKKNGTYHFRTASQVYSGKYTVGDGMVCVLFDDGGSRCDRYVKSGNGYVLINQRGRRFLAKVK